MSNGRRISVLAQIWVALILTVSFPSTAAAASPPTTANTRPTATASTSVQTTCPARKINYLTHSLPKQCLTNSWTSKVHSLLNTTGQTVQTSAPTTSGLPSSEIGDAAAIVRLGAQEEDIPPASLRSKEATTSSEAPRVSEARSGQSQSIQATPTIESDSPLDNANFLSFEDWKRQNLAKAGQSAEHLDARAVAGSEQRRRPGSANQALDFLGEDPEIDLDFSGFVGQGPMQNAPPLRGSNVKDGSAPEEGQLAEDGPRDGGNARKRPKDAGRTCKERTNYASYDCAASTLKTNKECKSPSAILVENKDTYMLNVCSAQNKFFIVELCDNILIDTVVLANFEFFSSMFRTFRVSVSDRYPVKLDKWREIGTYEARNSREIQAFLVENALIWARYVRVEILNHYGNEYYCPVSLFRIHGTTMMEEFNSELKGPGGDDEVEGEGTTDVEKTSDEPPVAAEHISKRDISTVESRAQDTVSGMDTLQSIETAASSPEASEHPDTRHLNAITMEGKSHYNTSAVYELESLFAAVRECPHSQLLLHGDQQDSNPTLAPTVSTQFSSLDVMPSVTAFIPPTQSRSTNAASHSNSVMSTSSNSTSTVTTLRSSNASVSSPVVGSSVVSSQNSSTAVRQSSQTQPQPANPTTQESFFKSVHKRLQLLEANSTLSLRYIEDQSKMLRDAFATVEKRQSAKTTLFLETLNKTVLTELVEFRQQYDQIWQSTVIELSTQREQSQHEVFALSARLSLLADEIVFQKRMAILQFMLMLLCLGVVIFSRSSPSSSFEFRPLMQNAFSRSSANLSKYAPLFDTPPSSPSASRPASRYGIFRSFTHRKSPSEETYGQEAIRRAPSIEYSPPTPESQPDNLSSFEVSPGKSDGAGSDVSDGLFEGPQMVRSLSSPATPEVMKEEKRQVRKAAFVEEGPTIEAMAEQRQHYD